MGMVALGDEGVAHHTRAQVIKIGRNTTVVDVTGQASSPSLQFHVVAVSVSLRGRTVPRLVSLSPSALGWKSRTV